MGVKSLVEAIILQSIEDLWDERQKRDCLSFFNGDGFNICAGAAGINSSDQVKLLNLINGLIKNESKSVKNLRKENYIEYSIS